MKLRSIVLSLIFALLVVSASGQDKPVSKKFLPQTFAGWTLAGAAKTGSDPAALGQAQSSVLSEYGFEFYELATYVNGDRKMSVKAARFKDASGAYGAFTFYREPKMEPERVGTIAASAQDHILFFRDNILVQAALDRVTAMSASELRDLASALPSLKGPAASLPTLPQYLPREKLLAHSGRYVLGPLAYQSLGLSVSPQTIDFNVNPEVLAAKFSFSNEPVDVVLISYPTPQIAIQKLPAFTQASQEAHIVAVKRSGPLVAVVTGNVSKSSADSLLSKINYEADVTWNENTGLSKRDNIGTIVIAALSIAGIVILFSLGAGTMFGFYRTVLRKILPARFAPAPDEAQIIRLHLEDHPETTRASETK